MCKNRYPGGERLLLEDWDCLKDYYSHLGERWCWSELGLWHGRKKSIVVPFKSHWLDVESDREELKNISWVVAWTAGQTMQLPIETWAEEQTRLKERATSAIDKFYRPTDHPQVMPWRHLGIRSFADALGLREGFGSLLWLDESGGHRRGSPECVRADVLELVLTEEYSWTPWNYMHDFVYRWK